MAMQELLLKTTEKPRLKQQTRIVYCSCGEAAVEHRGNPSTIIYCPNCGRYQKLPKTHKKG
jgi:hypothetical protein